MYRWIVHPSLLIAAIVTTIRQLTTPDAPTHGRKMGFHHGNR